MPRAGFRPLTCAIEDEEIISAIGLQEEVGLPSATDGEFRRATWHMDFIYQLGGGVLGGSGRGLRR
jgi:5-methyltetrahydropteroyltriglutamate--homocysteine methyltransferase